jgi:hypothetical protein
MVTFNELSPDRLNLVIGSLAKNTLDLGVFRQEFFETSQITGVESSNVVSHHLFCFFFDVSHVDFCSSNMRESMSLEKEAGRKGNDEAPKGAKSSD